MIGIFSDRRGVQSAIGILEALKAGQEYNLTYARLRVRAAFRERPRGAVVNLAAASADEYERRIDALDIVIRMLRKGIAE